MHITNILIPILSLYLYLYLLHLQTTQNQNIHNPCFINNCQICTYYNFCGLCNKGFIINVPVQYGYPICNAIACNVPNCDYCLSTDIC